MLNDKEKEFGPNNFHRDSKYHHKFHLLIIREKDTSLMKVATEYYFI